MISCFEKNYATVAENYLSDSDLKRIRRDFNDLDCLDEITEYLEGTDGEPAVGIPSEKKGWYKPRAGHEYWPAYLSLLRDPGRVNFPDDAVKSIDRATSRILNHIYDPSTDGERKSYGLVVGHVQSGKTANFTGLIAKAADSGFNLFVILSGMYNDLRQQTQMRLDRELTGRSKDHKGGCHVDEEGYSRKWNQVTNDSMDEGDIHQPGANRDPELLRSDSPSLVVTKKQVDALDAAINWALGLSFEERSKINLMLIDDEADLASINTEANDKKGREANAINKKLREFLHLFDRRAYVGYTATPFANVFVNPYGDGVQTKDPRIVSTGDPQDMDTLFPRDFIVALPKPKGYIGFHEMFPQEDEGLTIDPRRLVKEDEAKKIRGYLDDPFGPTTKELGPACIEALRDHLITHALRILRKKKKEEEGYRDFSHTMLIHSSISIDNHKPLVTRIDSNLQQWKGAFKKSYGRPDRKKIVKEFEKFYNKKYLDLDAVDDDGKKTRMWFHKNHREKEIPPPPWEEVVKEIRWIFKYKKPVVLNVSSDEKAGQDLDYHLHPKGRNVIAVGGLRLSRGLTLEGLTVSYFLRQAKEMKYDTVMQQGRWFGFRPGYSDLIRVYTTSSLLEKLTKIGRVEYELRESIGRYEDTGKTPFDFGVKVLKMGDMVPTEQKKMPNVDRTKANIDESIVPAWGDFSFDEPELLRSNLKSVSDLLNKLGKAKSPKGSKNSHLWSCDNPETVLEFLRSINHSSTHPKHFGEDFFAYVDRRLKAGRGELSNWSIALISLQSGNGEKTKPLSDYGCDLKVIKPRRGRLPDTDTLGYFADSSNFILDLGGGMKDYHGSNGKYSLSKMWEKRDSSNPFVAIYIFDKGYKPTGTKIQMFHSKEEQDNPVDVVAVSVALPKAEMTEEEKNSEKEYWYNKFLPRDPEEGASSEEE